MTSGALEGSLPRSFFRLGVILLVFPFILAYALPQTDLAARFFQGDRSLWLRFWVLAVTLEWMTLATVVASFRCRLASLQAVGLSLPLSRREAYLLLSLVLGAMALAVVGAGRPQDFLGRIPIGFQMFIPPSQIEARLFWVLVSLTAAVTEEAMWRGIAITELRGLTGSKMVAVSISSASFAFFHGGLAQGLPALAYRFVIGLVLAVLYMRSGSLRTVIVIHFFMDASALMAVQLD